MTATISPLPPPRRPARSGELWTEDDYETLARLCLDGADLAAVAEALERRDTAVLDRARRMLPLDERGLPADRALVQLRAHLREDAGYDWASALTQSPPPRPVEHRVYTEQLSGVRGLEDEELLDVAELVVGSVPTHASTHAAVHLRTHRQVLDAILGRSLTVELAHRIGERMVDRALAAAGRRLPVGDRWHPDEFWGLEPDEGPWGGDPGTEAWPGADEPWDA